MERVHTPKVVLGVAAHPDDLDFAFGGSIAQWAKTGTKVYYLILTDGSLGTTDRSLPPGALQNKRRNEQQAAAALLGVTEVFFAQYKDCDLHVCTEVTRDIVQAIREVKPDMVITLDPTMVYSAKEGIINHPDHRAAGQATLDAIYPLARDHLAYPELLEQRLQPHEVSTVLLCNFNEANAFVELKTSDVATKRLALEAHHSQFDTNPAAIEFAERLAKEKGASCGTLLAETFVQIKIS